MIELNKIYNEDCLIGMQRIPDKSIDAIICDLPYQVTACKWDKIIPFEPLWEQYNRVIKDNGAIVLFGKEPFSSKLRMSNIDNYKYDIIWEKHQSTNPMCAKKRIMPIHENISIFYKKQCTYNPQMRMGFCNYNSYVGDKQIGEIYGKTKSIHRNCNDGSRYPTSVIKFQNIRGGLHPTSKPVDLLEYLIKTYSNEGKTILDNCIGSGTTAIACINTNRNFIGFELDKGYYDIACKRIEEALKEKENKLF